MTDELSLQITHRCADTKLAINNDDDNLSLGELLNDESSFVLMGGVKQNNTSECSQKRAWDCTITPSDACEWSNGKCQDQAANSQVRPNYEISKALNLFYYSSMERPKILDSLLGKKGKKKPSRKQASKKKKKHQPSKKKKKQPSKKKNKSRRKKPK
jgi:hypothetical protein